MCKFCFVFSCFDVSCSPKVAWCEFSVRRFFKLIKAWLVQRDLEGSSFNCSPVDWTEICLDNKLAKGSEQEDCPTFLKVYMKTELFCIEGALLWFKALAHFHPDLCNE